MTTCIKLAGCSLLDKWVTHAGLEPIMTSKSVNCDKIAETRINNLPRPEQ